MTDAPGSDQSQGQGKRSPLVVGLAASVFAAAVTAIVLISSGPSPDVATDAAGNRQCPLAPRKLMLATETGSGAIRMRAGSYVSPPITLTKEPQAVVFPLPRPDTTPVEEVIMIEGTATNLVLSSDLTNFRRVIDTIIGASPLNVTWAPLRKC